MKQLSASRTLRRWTVQAALTTARHHNVGVRLQCAVMMANLKRRLAVGANVLRQQQWQRWWRRPRRRQLLCGLQQAVTLTLSRFFETSSQSSTRRIQSSVVRFAVCTSMVCLLA
jgi:hypothetical protein